MTGGVDGFDRGRTPYDVYNVATGTTSRSPRSHDLPRQHGTDENEVHFDYSGRSLKGDVHRAPELRPDQAFGWRCHFPTAAVERSMMSMISDNENGLF